MPISVSNCYRILFEVDEITLDLDNIPRDKLEATIEKKRKKLIDDLIGKSGNIENLKQFCERHCKNEKVGKFLFGEDFKLQPEPLSEARVRDKLKELNAKYKYEISLEEYSKAVRACLYQAKVIEKNNNGDEVYTRAYKMLAVFCSMQKFDEFAKNFGDKYPNPVHDILQREIPEATDIDMPSWVRLIMKVGMDALEGFEHADRLPKAPESKEELAKMLGELSYKRASEDQEFAKLCKIYNVPEDVFNRTLDLIKDGTIKLKSQDNIPSVTVKAEDIDASAKGVYLVKLPAGNLRGAIMGKITDCCQSIGGSSEACVIDGLTRDNNSFYVLVKGTQANFDPSKIDWENLEQNAKIVGQGYVWRTQAGNIVIDSWEGLGTTYDWLMPKILPVFGQKLHEADPSIHSVNIGHGGKTPNSLKEAAVVEEAPKEGFMYGDSGTQYNVYTSDELKKKREELSKRTGIEYQTSIFTPAVADKLLAIKDNKLRKINEDKYAVLTLQNNVDWTVANLEKIKELPLQLFSPYGTAIYTILKFSIEDLIGLNTLDLHKKIAIAVLRNRGNNEEDISALASLSDVPKIELLMSDEAKTAYESEKVTLAELKDLPISKIKLLISRDAQKAYQTEKVTFADLKNLPDDKIKALISNSAMQLYKKGETAKSLSGYSEHKIDSINRLETHYSRPTLKGLSEIVIDFIISNATYDFYESSSFQLDELQRLTDLVAVRKLSVHFLKEAGYPYDLSAINSIDSITKLKLLIDPQFMDYNRDFGIKIEDLKDIPDSKFEMLTSLDAMKAYRTDKVTFADLKNLPEVVIMRRITKVLFSQLDTVQLSDFDSVSDISILQGLCGLCSWDTYEINKCIKSGYVKINDLKELTPDRMSSLADRMASLVGPSAIYLYEECGCTFGELKDFSTQKIYLLASNHHSLEEDNLQFFYRKKFFKCTDIMHLSIEKIKLLSSTPAFSLYHSKKVNFHELKDFSEDALKQLLTKSSYRLLSSQSFPDLLKTYKEDFSHADQVVAERIIKQKEQEVQKQTSTL